MNKLIIPYGFLFWMSCTPGERQSARAIVENVQTLCGDIEHGVIVVPGKTGRDAVVLCAKEEEAVQAANQVIQQRAAQSVADAEMSDTRD